MFGAGCVLSELYLNTPLFSKTILSQPSTTTTTTTATTTNNKSRPPLPEEIYDLPVPVRAAIQWLVQDDHRLRPTAAELLRLRRGPHIHDRDYDDCNGTPTPTTTPSATTPSTDTTTPTNATTTTTPRVPYHPRIVNFRRACQSLFPEYFGELYGYLSTIYMYRQRGAMFSEISFTLGCTLHLAELPLAAFSLVLPYMLHVLADPSLFEKDFEEAETSKSSSKVSTTTTTTTTTTATTIPKHNRTMTLTPIPLCPYHSEHYHHQSLKSTLSWMNWARNWVRDTHSD